MTVKSWLVPLLLAAGSALAQPAPETTPPATSQPEAEDEVLGWEPILPEEEAEAVEEAEGELVEVPWAEDPNDIPVNWVDESHAYATNQAQALTEWMDAFFGDPEYDAEQAESLLRLELANEWDEEDGNDFSVRLRGKVQLPKISRRLNLVFAGEERTRALNEALVADARAAGARAFLVAEDADRPALRLPAVPSVARPVVEILPVEMLTLAIPALDGREAGTFRVGGKVTTTE